MTDKARARFIGEINPAHEPGQPCRGSENPEKLVGSRAAVERLHANREGECAQAGGEGGPRGPARKHSGEPCQHEAAPLRARIRIMTTSNVAAPNTRTHTLGSAPDP